ncbi:hypothetical protein D0869_04650 [Hortaea werneckii]|uniref:Uncharacterized protein n=1 Tax=Hortaea werneckii TaxID=91943 RepID=A0A3M6Z2X4_HORWE|nr:hypothetical protein KC324_g1780 [Hortaea werneckii]KAI7593248.1 hypothetical protein KC316_g1854 [Hortaea werneckii]RMX84335.1 hypothetical protein D0869_04650 [Hortaea werneckii]RMY09623.1 hypothetical protein D0868_04151 [Hortaea werneckii]
MIGRRKPASQRFEACSLPAVASTPDTLTSRCLHAWAKQYGVHLGGSSDPMKESDRWLTVFDCPHNSYYAQQDILSEKRKEQGWAWVVTFCLIYLSGRSRLKTSEEEERKFDETARPIVPLLERPRIDDFAAEPGFKSIKAVKQRRLQQNIDLVKWFQRADVKVAWEKLAKRDGLEH